MNLSNTLSRLMVLPISVAVMSGCACPETTGVFSADRPGFATSPAVVPPCRAQIEAGWMRTEDRDGEGNRTTTNAFPETLLRIGLMRNLEVRLDYGGYVWRKDQAGDGATQRTSGSSDAGVGIKYRFFAGSRWLPESAVIASTSAPLGSDRLSSHRHDPSLLFAFAHEDLHDLFSLNYNVGLEWETSEDDSSDRHTNTLLLYALSLGANITERLGAFAEFYGSKPFNPAASPSNGIDGGFTYLVTPVLQADVSGGVGLSDAADDWFVGAGLSWRFSE